VGRGDRLSFLVPEHLRGVRIESSLSQVGVGAMEGKPASPVCATKDSTSFGKKSDTEADK
jgi:hypothetical protein